MIALLKIVAFMEDQHRRQKDLLDLTELFQHYEATTDRIFSDDVFAAELEDVDCANAFLLGLDMGAIVDEKEAEILNAFTRVQRLSGEDLEDLDPEDPRQREVLRFQRQLRAFWKGFEQGWQR